MDIKRKKAEDITKDSWVLRFSGDDIHCCTKDEFECRGLFDRDGHESEREELLLSVTLEDPPDCNHEGTKEPCCGECCGWYPKTRWVDVKFCPFCGYKPKE